MYRRINFGYTNGISQAKSTKSYGRANTQSNSHPLSLLRIHAKTTQSSLLCTLSVVSQQIMPYTNGYTPPLLL